MQFVLKSLKFALIAACLIILSIFEFGNVKSEVKYVSRSVPFGSINIVTVLTNTSDYSAYQVAIDSMKCYARIHSYNFTIVNDNDYADRCNHTDKFFRRHCVVALLLNQSDYTLVVDADMGVVNPKRKIEEFIDTKFDITFYDRFFNYEVAACSFLVKNSDWSRSFLHGLADFQYRLPKSYHGTDNGALHPYLVEVILPDQLHEVEECHRLWNNSQCMDDLFSAELCFRLALGRHTDFGRIRILKKLNGWARDHWIANGFWDSENDFMVHGWKDKNMITYGNVPPIVLTHKHLQWFNPLKGTFRLDLCTPGNTTWSYDRNLIATTAVIDPVVHKFAKKLSRLQYRYLARMEESLSLIEKGEKREKETCNNIRAEMQHY